MMNCGQNPVEPRLTDPEIIYRSIMQEQIIRMDFEKDFLAILEVVGARFGKVLESWEFPINYLSECKNTLCSVIITFKRICD